MKDAGDIPRVRRVKCFSNKLISYESKALSIGDANGWTAQLALPYWHEYG